MRNFLYTILFFFSITYSFCQSIGIGTTTPDTSAILDLSSDSLGILIPRMTESEKNNIANPAEGLMMYQTGNDAGFYYHTLGTWHQIGKGGNQWTKNGSELFTLSEQVGIGTNDVHSSAAFEIANDIKGILIPRVSQIDREDILDPADGLLVYQFNNNYGFYFYHNGWQKIGGGGNAWSENTTTLFTNKNVGISIDTATIRFQVNNGSEVYNDPYSGYLMLGRADTTNLVMDYKTIQARDELNPTSLYLQPFSGNLEIGGSTSKVTINSTAESGLNNGAIVIDGGPYGSMSIDRDELQVYEAGIPDTLNLQKNGGDTYIGNQNSSVYIMGFQGYPVNSDGPLVVGIPEHRNLNIGENGIQARNVNTGTGVPYAELLRLNPHGGDIEIGSSTDMEVKVLSSQDMNLSQSGGFSVGGAFKVTIDDDEIQARNGLAANTLTLQRNGGSLRVGSTVSSSILLAENKVKALANNNPTPLILQQDGSDVEIGNSTSNVRILSTQAASLSNNGGLTIGNSASPQLLLDYDGIQSKYIENTYPLFLQSHGGDVWIGDNVIVNGAFTNKMPLSILGGTSTSLINNSGYLTIGDSTNTHISIDNNRIQARDNGNNSDLEIQPLGGNLVIGNAGTSVRMRGTGIASLTGNGVATMGSFAGKHLVFGSDEVQVRNGSNFDDLKLQEDGGKIGIGIAPSALLHLKGIDATNNRHIRLESNGSSDNTSIYAGQNFTIENSSEFGDFIFRNGFTDINVFRVSPLGRVAIGNTGLDTNYLKVYNGVSTGRYTQTGWIHNSDKNLKTNITTLSNSLEKILQLRGVSFNWKGNPTSNNQIGFIAQEVEPIFPEVVSKDENGLYSMAYQNLVAPLVEAIKEQQIMIEELKMKNEELKVKSENDYNSLKAELEYIKQIISSQNIVIKK